MEKAFVLYSGHKHDGDDSDSSDYDNDDYGEYDNVRRALYCLP